MLSDDFNHHQVHHNHRDSESRPEPPIQDDHHQQPTPQPRVLTILSYVLEKLVARNNHLVLSNNGTTSSYHDDDQHHHQMRKNYLKGFDGVRAPSISIPKYLERIYKYTNCSLSCFVVGYVYLDRLIHRYPDSLVVSLNIHRLLLTCVMVASKMLDDVNCNNAFFARVGGVTNSELNRLELELLFLLDFRVVVSSNVFETYCHHLEKEMHRNGATPLITSFAAHNATDVSVEAHSTTSNNSSSPDPKIK
ncbi:OLC1v1025063C1 [Oldenlandia corymbosa var. corymbosa]|uniref:Cyclin n=1 Tax=Oldenlandia corymbosa var. corymbosa TaxID=529605 RepID=A0AAV1C6V6_OLDCO|nr:OLC1v1025063C1 [Oldenlandia corymbosa var. corymbosa]